MMCAVASANTLLVMAHAVCFFSRAYAIRVPESLRSIRVPGSSHLPVFGVFARILGADGFTQGGAFSERTLRGLLVQRLRIDVAISANAEAQFNAPPHRSEFN